MKRDDNDEEKKRNLSRGLRFHVAEEQSG